MATPPICSSSMPSTSMPSPNPNYCRPVILPWTMESYRQFSQICASGDLAKVAELVETVPRSQEYLTEGLRAAIAEHNISIAEFLLRRMSDIGHEIANAAASAKSLPIFELLLEHGWDINAPVLGNATVFERVLEDEQLVRWFLQNGAQLDPSLRSFNPSAAKVFSTTPSGCLEIAASISSVAVLDLLLEHGATKANGFPLHSAAGSAAEDDRIPMMAHLIELGYDVNVTDQGRGDHKIGTPLQYAIMAKSFARVEFLLHEGADPHKAVGRCGSAFKMAERMGMDQIVDLMKRFS